MQLLDQAETDSAFDEREHPDLLSFLAFERRVSAGLYLAAQRLASNKFEPTPEAIELLTSLDFFLSRLILKFENFKDFAGIDEALVRLQDSASKPHSDPSLRAICNLALEAPLAIATLRTFTILSHRPDFVSVLIGNLRKSLPNIFRQSILIPNIPALKHAAKCATAILICAIICVTLNWDNGIGCVETVMLVVQTTFGGTLMIGSLRFLGVLMGFSLAIFAVLFLIPLVSTIACFLMIFAPVLFSVIMICHDNKQPSIFTLRT